MFCTLIESMSTIFLHKPRVWCRNHSLYTCGAFAIGYYVIEQINKETVMKAAANPN